MTDPCVLRSPDFYDEGYAQVTAYGKYVGELLPGSKLLKLSKLFLNVDKLKNFPKKKVYVHMLYNENYLFIYKKHMHNLF